MCYEIAKCMILPNSEKNPIHVDFKACGHGIQIKPYAEKFAARITLLSQKIYEHQETYGHVELKNFSDILLSSLKFFEF